RYIKTFRLSLIVSLSIMALGTIIFQSAPHLLLKIFKASGALLSMGVPAMRILSASFLFAAFTIIIIVLLQSLGKGASALILSLMRQLLLLMPLTYLLSATLGVAGVWWSYPIAELATAAVALPLGIYTIKKRFRELNNPAVTNEI
ncbi:MAG: MATE family efflux transporter, partial [Clostridia bacterium]|nr:MATE family efflux transporter [Clostridia bacterium]